MRMSISPNIADLEREKFINIDDTPVSMISNINVPKSYYRKKITEFKTVTTIRCQNPNKLYKIPVDITKLDGTNMVSHSEVFLAFNDFAAPTGAGVAAEKVSLYRQNGVVDGTTDPIATNLFDWAQITSPNLALFPDITPWDTRDYAIACTADTTIQITIRHLVYTPG